MLFSKHKSTANNVAFFKTLDNARDHFINRYILPINIYRLLMVASLLFLTQFILHDKHIKLCAFTFNKQQHRPTYCFWKMFYLNLLNLFVFALVPLAERVTQGHIATPASKCNVL